MFLHKPHTTAAAKFAVGRSTAVYTKAAQLTPAERAKAMAAANKHLVQHAQGETI